MKTLIAVLVFCLSCLPGSGNADSPVVVELFTSQGCSSCPAADRLMHRLAEREDVIALALHVDYWDYIGWKDPFASPANTERQKAYAVESGRRSVYTPQMVVGGRDSVVGTRAMELDALIEAHSNLESPVEITLARDGDVVEISARYDGPAPERAMVVELVRYTPRETTDITRGENAGKRLTYVNIVRDWKTLREWDGREDLRVSTRLDGDLSAVVLVQFAGNGPVVGAARLD